MIQIKKSTLYYWILIIVLELAFVAYYKGLISGLPIPNPQPASLTEWVRLNIPASGKSQAASLAECYESVAREIESGSIRSQDAANATIRMNTQTKIKPEIWEPFLDKLAVKVTEKLDGSTDVQKLGTIFSEIAIGLKGT